MQWWQFHAKGQWQWALAALVSPLWDSGRWERSYPLVAWLHTADYDGEWYVFQHCPYQQLYFVFLLWVPAIPAQKSTMTHVQHGYLTIIRFAAAHVINRKYCCSCGCLLYGVFTIQCALLAHWNLAYLYMIANGIGLALIIPASYSLMVDVVHDEFKGTAFGWQYATGAFGCGLASFVATPIGTSWLGSHKQLQIDAMWTTIRARQMRECNLLIQTSQHRPVWLGHHFLQLLWLQVGVMNHMKGCLYKCCLKQSAIADICCRQEWDLELDRLESAPPDHRSHQCHFGYFWCRFDEGPSIQEGWWRNLGGRGSTRFDLEHHQGSLRHASHVVDHSAGNLAPPIQYAMQIKMMH